MQARTPEMAGMIERERLCWAFAQAYVCGIFASAYSDDLLRYFPTMARIYADVRGMMAKRHARASWPRS